MSWAPPRGTVSSCCQLRVLPLAYHTALHLISCPIINSFIAHSLISLMIKLISNLWNEPLKSLGMSRNF